MTQEEVSLLKRKLTVLLHTAATHSADCLVLSPHLTEGRRVNHRLIANLLQNVVNHHPGGKLSSQLVHFVYSFAYLSESL